MLSPSSLPSLLALRVCRHKAMGRSQRDPLGGQPQSPALQYRGVCFLSRARSSRNFDLPMAFDLLSTTRSLFEPRFESPARYVQWYVYMKKRQQGIVPHSNLRFEWLCRHQVGTATPWTRFAECASRYPPLHCPGALSGLDPTRSAGFGRKITRKISCSSRLFLRNNEPRWLPATLGHSADTSSWSKSPSAGFGRKISRKIGCSSVVPQKQRTYVALLFNLPPHLWVSRSRPTEILRRSWPKNLSFLDGNAHMWLYCFPYPHIYGHLYIILQKIPAGFGGKSVVPRLFLNINSNIWLVYPSFLPHSAELALRAASIFPWLSICFPALPVFEPRFEYPAWYIQWYLYMKKRRKGIVPHSNLRFE